MLYYVIILRKDQILFHYNRLNISNDEEAEKKL